MQNFGCCEILKYSMTHMDFVQKTKLYSVKIKGIKVFNVKSFIILDLLRNFKS